jgi:hypothetical protein
MAGVAADNNRQQLGRAEWRLEIELVQPSDHVSMGRALHLHYLIRKLTDGSLPRNSLSTLVPPLLHSTQYDRRKQFARCILRTICESGGLQCNRNTGYPNQPRPHDLTHRDLGVLPRCLVSPKVDGWESFLVCHAHGAEVLFRNGDAVHLDWTGLGDSLFPVVMEGELMNPNAFIVYDILVSPVASYLCSGKPATRQHALQAVLRRLQHRLCCYGPTTPGYDG